MGVQRRFWISLLATFLLAGCQGGGPSQTPESGQEVGAESPAPAEPQQEAAPEQAEEEASTAGPAEAEEASKEPDRPQDKPGGPPPALLNPALAVEQAPARFQVRFETTKGPFVAEVVREWAPRGVDRFYNLVRIGYFQEIAFFRVLDGFVAQFGLHGDPAVNEAWSGANIQDDPVQISNLRGTISFATAGPNTRSTQLFINLVDNPRLDQMGFAPIARIVDGMEVVESLYSGYGEGAPRGEGPAQDQIRSRGNQYLKSQFPRLDYIRRIVILP